MSLRITLEQGEVVIDEDALAALHAKVERYEAALRDHKCIKPFIASDGIPGMKTDRSDLDAALAADTPPGDRLLEEASLSADGARGLAEGRSHASDARSRPQAFGESLVAHDRHEFQGLAHGLEAGEGVGDSVERVVDSDSSHADTVPETVAERNTPPGDRCPRCDSDGTEMPIYLCSDPWHTQPTESEGS